jgi:glutamate 5-kinase
MKSKRWVIKCGTGILTDSKGRLDLPQIGRLVRQVAALQDKGYEIVLVTSGAIGGGMGSLHLKKRPARVEHLQACAAIGQPRLMGIYEKLLARHGLHVAQLLLTYWDLTNRVLYANTRKTIGHLFKLKSFLPVINENDAVASDEIQPGARFGDNDMLSAHVAVMVGASRLIILSNVPGLMNKSDGTGGIISVVKKVDAGVEALAGSTRSQTSVGGMVTKLRAAKFVNARGITMQIANGRAPDVLNSICQGKRIGTTFLP